MTTSTCGCCAGVASRTPMPVHNRPGLSAVAYRIGTHPEFLASMIAALTDAGRPQLAELATRDPDDLTIALLDAWAVVGDVLTFYTERLAQESWLRTAVDRRSLQELGRLVGHRMAPGVAAQTHLAFAVEPPPTVPETAGRDPGVAPPVTPPAVVVPTGTRVQSIPGPGEQPQTFETVEAVTARPAHNAMAAATSTPAVPTEGDESAWLAGVATNLTSGDVLLFVGGDIADNHWDVKVIDDVTPDVDNDRTEVRWTGELRQISPAGATEEPEVFALRKRLRVFGHNAPAWQAMSAEFKDEYLGPGPDPDPDPGDWPEFLITAGSGQAVDLDGSHPDISPKSWVVLSRPAWDELFRVSSVQELSRAEFAISGTVTRLGLTVGDFYWYYEHQVRDTTVWAVADELHLAEAPDGNNVTGGTVVVDADASNLRPGATVIVAGSTTGGAEHSEVGIVAATSAVAGTGRWLVELEEGLEEDYVRDTVVVHGNVALATHGETVDEVLGAGRGRDAFQTFTLSHGPVTHVPAATSSGVASTLTVRVNDVAWKEVTTQYDGESGDHTFTSTVDEQGDRTVTFGDGRRGARLPTGTNNVRATYRKGHGTDGNVGAGALAQLLDRPLGLKGVSNPKAASGGVEPEGPEQARTAIPLAVRTLGRAVSLLDYEDFARAYPGISKAQATVLPLPQGRTIVTTVAITPGTGDDGSRLDDLTDALRDHGDPQVQVLVVEHDTDAFRLSMTVTVDPAHDRDVVLTGIEDAMAKAFSFSARNFLAPVHQSDVVAVAHQVPGVVGVDLNRLYALGQPPPPDLLADRLVPQQPAVSPEMKPIPAGLLLIAESPFDELKEAAS